MDPKIILGSHSPRRREILEFFSLPFRQACSDFDEAQLPFAGDPVAFAKQAAYCKAKALAEKYPHEIVLTADTIVYQQGRLFLKPKTVQQAHAMLRDLSGKEHTVVTGVCVIQGKNQWSDTEKTLVEFCQLTDSEIQSYVKSLHPLDKAGGYAIQKGGSLIVKRIEGCYYNVMGLPLQTVRRLLLKTGIDLWHYLKSV